MAVASGRQLAAEGARLGIAAADVGLAANCYHIQLVRSLSGREEALCPVQVAWISKELWQRVEGLLSLLSDDMGDGRSA